MMMAQREYEIPAEFLDAADRFVTLANEIGADRSSDWVRAVMMYATARYNAFAWLTRSDAPAQTADQAASYYAGEYRTMFGENLKEIEPVYRAAAGGPAGPDQKMQ
jgi:hypothetical protein